MAHCGHIDSTCGARARRDSEAGHRDNLQGGMHAVHVDGRMNCTGLGPTQTCVEGVRAV